MMNRIATVMVTLLMVTTLLSCGSRSVRGKGNVVTDNRDEGNFDAVTLAGSMDVDVVAGSGHSIRIEAEENLLKYIITHVEDGKLEIRVKDGIRLRPKKKILIYVSAPSFKRLSVSGSGSMVAERTLLTDDKLKLEVTGSGDIRVADVDAPDVTVKVTGSGTVNVSGLSRDADFHITGSGDIKAGSLKTENAKVQITGGGDVWTYCSQQLDVRITGSGDVRYAGKPVSVKKKLAGSGDLIEVE